MNCEVNSNHFPNVAVNKNIDGKTITMPTSPRAKKKALKNHGNARQTTRTDVKYKSVPTGTNA